MNRVACPTSDRSSQRNTTDPAHESVAGGTEYAAGSVGGPAEPNGAIPTEPSQAETQVAPAILPHGAHARTAAEAEQRRDRLWFELLTFDVALAHMRARELRARAEQTIARSRAKQAEQRAAWDGRTERRRGGRWRGDSGGCWRRCAMAARSAWSTIQAATPEADALSIALALSHGGEVRDA